MIKNPLKNSSGLTLIEVMVSLAVIVILMMGIYSLVILSLNITADNTSYVEAISIANQKMERIRNLPYANVGTLTGSPPGIIPEYETINKTAIFTVHATVIFYDDPYDGTIASSTDSIGNDYKIVTIDVSWQGHFKSKNVTVFSKVIPKTEETNEGYGLLKIYAVDANGSPVPNADIHVQSAVPSISADYITDGNGFFYLLLLPAFENYEVTVTKADYGADKTYARDAINLNPSKPNISIFNGAKTEESFSIDKLAALNIRTVANTLPNNWMVNAAGNDDKANVRFSGDNSNNMYFVWQNSSATSSFVYVQKYSQTAVKQWGSDYKISATKFQKNPDIAAAANGDSFIVWQDNSSALKLISKNKPSNRIVLAEPKLNDLTNARTEFAILPAQANLAPTFNQKIIDFISPKSFINYNKYSQVIINYLGGIFDFKPAQAAGGVAIVQTKIGSPGNNTYQLSAAFNSPPTAGNVIIAIAAHRNNNSAFNAPTNAAGVFTQSAYSNSSWYLDVGIWHKIAGAGEPSQVNITSTQIIGGGVLMIMEVSGLDTSNLLNVTTTNDQTGGNSLTATTGATAVSTDTGWAVAAIGWGDNNFNMPNSSNWSSGSADNWTQQLWNDWSTGNNGSLAAASLNITATAAQRATLTLTGGGGEQRNSALAVFHVASSNDVTVNNLGNQVSSTTIPASGLFVGGGFVIINNTTPRDVTGINITEHGTVDAQTGLANVKLYYDLDNTYPYDCAGEIYNAGSDLQFGSSATFNGADGIALFNNAGGVDIAATQSMCVYVVLDVTASAIKDNTLEIKINNTTADVIISSGAITPAVNIEISETTDLLAPAKLWQYHYRWHNDDGNETNATWRADEDMPATISINQIIRLRFAIANKGSITSSSVEYQIEYGEAASTCASITSWLTLPNNDTLAWRMADSANFTDGDSSTNVVGDLTDENVNFKAGYLQDTSAKTVGLALTADEFTEIEYSIKATNLATDSDYCFRLSDNGATAVFNYDVYPLISIIGDDNIYLIRLNENSNPLWTIKKVNSDSGDASQSNPRLALTEKFGPATTTVVWEDNRNGNTDIYAQIFDLNGNKLLSNDLQITSSSTDEISPAVAMDSNDNIVVAWVDNTAGGKDIYLQKYDFTGSPVWTSPKTIAATSDDEYSPAVKTDPAGNIYLAWTENNNGNLNVKLAKYDNNGNNIWGKQANVENPIDDQYDPEIIADNSNIYVGWTDFREGNEDIYTQKYDSSGSALWTKDIKVNINLGTSSQSNAVLWLNSAGKTFAAWQDSRNNGLDIYASGCNGPSVLNNIPNVPIVVTGTKRIGENPVIYEYNQTHTTDASGYSNLTLEWDTPGYSVDLKTASTSLTIILRDPPQPVSLLPGETKTMILYVE